MNQSPERVASLLAKNSDSLTGSELDGADQDLAEWAGIEIPPEKYNDYINLVGGTYPLEKFFETIKNGWFEVTYTEEDMESGLNDTYWEIQFDDADALRAEIRARLIKELHLSEHPAPKRKTRGRVSGQRSDGRAEDAGEPPVSTSKRTE